MAVMKDLQTLVGASPAIVYTTQVSGDAALQAFVSIEEKGPFWTLPSIPLREGIKRHFLVPLQAAFLHPGEQ